MQTISGLMLWSVVLWIFVYEFSKCTRGLKEVDIPKRNHLYANPFLMGRGQKSYVSVYDFVKFAI